MKVVLLGAAGIIGADIARYLSNAKMDSLILADLREDRSKAIAREIGVDAAALDVTDSAATTRLLRGSDLAINATTYYHNLAVMEACLSAGCDYVDLGGLYHTTRKQLSLGKRFQQAGRLAILGCGKAPGFTNLLAARGAESFDHLDDVQLRSGRRPLDGDDGVRLPYSSQTLLDEFTLRPVILKDGELREVEPLSSRETVRHPEPFGAIEYVTTLHSELATLPTFLGKGIRSMEFKVALAAPTVRVLETLVSLGFASETPLSTPHGPVVPRDVAVAMLARLPQRTGREIWIVEVEMTGVSKGRPLNVTLRITGDETTNGTALAAVVAAGMLRDGLVRGTGVHGPEAVIPAEEVLRRAAERGLRITETRNESGEVAG